MYDKRGFDNAVYAKQRFEWLHPQVAEFCRERELDYPELNEAGDIIGRFPRGM